MVTQIEPLTFQYSHTIGRQETRGGNGFFHPVAVARGEGNRLYVLSRGTETPVFWPCKRVTICTIEEEYLGQFGEKIPPEEAVSSAPDGTFFWPTSIALDKQGNAYVADEWLNRISVFTKDGDWIGKWGTPGAGDGEINRPSGLAFGADDNLYVVDSVNNRIQVFTKEGKFLFKWGGSGSGQTWPRHPCHQWGLKTTGCARVPDRVLTSRTRLGMLCCITYCSDCSFQRKTSCRVKSRRVRVSSVSASPMS